MIDDLILVLTFAAIVGSGTIGGAFFAFSTFVMKALGRQPAPHGIATMQTINVVVFNPWFMVAFFGTALVSVALAVAALLGWGDGGTGWLIAGGLLYVAGTFGVTAAFNVPRNDALAKVAADGAEGAAYWARYLREWTAWNTVRTVAALAAAVAFTVALVV